MPSAETLPTNDINALMFCTESTVIPPYSNGYIRCRIPKARGKAYISRSCVTEPSIKHRSLYSHCKTYKCLVTVNDRTQYPDYGILHSCEDSQI